MTIGVSHKMTEADIDEITHVAALYVKWQHLFSRGGPLEGDSTAMDLMLRPAVMHVWPHVYDVAYKAGHRAGRRWAFMVIGFAGYGFGAIMVQAAGGLWHLLQ